MEWHLNMYELNMASFNVYFYDDGMNGDFNQYSLHKY